MLIFAVDIFKEILKLSNKLKVVDHTTGCTDNISMESASPEQRKDVCLWKTVISQRTYLQGCKAYLDMYYLNVS